MYKKNVYTEMDSGWKYKDGDCGRLQLTRVMASISMELNLKFNLCMLITVFLYNRIMVHKY